MAVKPKLALIPSGVKANKVYSVLPADGTGDFDFSRSGSATRVNKDGLIEMVDADVPRLNYPLIDGVVSGCPSLLLEPESRNLIEYSENFFTTFWDKSQVTITPNNVISPDGTLNADKIEITTLNTPNLRQTVGVLPTTQYTFSFYAKSDDLSNLKLAIEDVSNGVFITEDVKKLINSQWSRISVTFTTPTGCNSIRTFIFRTSEELGSFYVWGAMLEVGSFATSYIPNLLTGSTTRSAETCNGAGDVNTFNDSEGVLMAEIKGFENDAISRAISISNGTTLNRINLFYPSNQSQVIGRVNAGSSTPSADMIYTGITQTTFNKIAVKWKVNDFALWVNGIEVLTDLNGAVPSGLNVISFDNASSAVFLGNTKQIQYFDTALTDTDLEELTSWTSFNEMAESQLYTIQ